MHHPLVWFNENTVHSLSPAGLHQTAPFKFRKAGFPWLERSSHRTAPEVVGSVLRIGTKNNNKKATMAEAVFGVSIAIFGMASPKLGCSCEWHPICGAHVDIDTLIRFKRTTVEGGKWKKQWSISSFILLHAVLLLSDRNKYRTILGAYWVTEGWDRCLIGHVSEEFQQYFSRLEGRLAQVVEIYSASRSSKKKQYSTLHNGVCHAMLVDKGSLSDSAMASCLTIVDSNSDSDEN